MYDCHFVLCLYIYVFKQKLLLVLPDIVAVISTLPYRRGARFEV